MSVRRPVPTRVSLPSAAVLCAVLLAVGGCTSHEADALETYTDPGDGCQQAISAIGFADDVLKPLGQEHYQVFDDEVRSKIAAVEGQLALEAHDWPNGSIGKQADVVRELAQKAAVKEATPERERALLEYRGEAARLVLLCRDALDDGR